MPLSLPADFPVLAILSRVDGRPAIIHVITGYQDPDIIHAELAAQQRALATVRTAEQGARQAADDRRSVVAEQDLEYQLSLAMDESRAEAASHAEREEAEQLRLAAELSAAQQAEEIQAKVCAC